MDVNLDTMWNNLASVSFASQTESFKSAVKPVFLRLPIALEALLDKTVTLETYYQVRIEVIRFYLETGYTRISVEAMPKEKRLGSVESLISLGERLLKGALEQMPDYSVVLAHLVKHGLNEDAVMLSPGVKISGEARELYLKHELTVGKLLELQPYVFTDFTSQ